MKHMIQIEERYFSEDVKSLMEYDSEFKAAYDSGNKYEMTIALDKLAELCPRKFQKKMMYDRLITFLKQKGIVIIIKSRKKDKSDQKEPLPYNSYSELNDNEARNKNCNQIEEL